MTTAFGGLKVHPAAEEFPLVDEQARSELAGSIKTLGQRRPIVLTADGTTILDGRNRYLACIDAGIEPKFEKFQNGATELDIVNFIKIENFNRRDLNPGQRAMIAVAFDARIGKLQAAAKERQREGGKEAGRGRQKVGAKSSQAIRAPKVTEQIAAGAKVADSTVKQALKVKDVSPRLARDVQDGKITLNAAYKEVRNASMEARPASSKTHLMLKTHLGEDVPYKFPKGKAKFNSTNQQVSWSAWTWNPVTGCLHGCKYCYARELAYRESYSDAYPRKFDPVFHAERLEAPANTPVPAGAVAGSKLKRVFVCSMADLYGKWVPDEWIDKVHASCSANPQWDYLMLTKFPRRYVDLQLPPTAWIGTSVDEQKRVRLAEEAFRQIKGVRVKWLSLEPLLAPLEFTDLSMFDWIVIGSQSATEQPDGPVPAFAPPFEWVARLTAQARECGCRIYHKPNLLGTTNPQSAGMTLIQEEPFVPNGKDCQSSQGDLGLATP